MVDRKELQDKIVGYRILEARLDSLVKQRDTLAHKLVEIQTTISSIDEIEKSSEDILFPIGSEAYTFGKVVDKKKMIVEIGANVALEKTIEESRGILKKRMEEIEKLIADLQKDVVKVSVSLEDLGYEIQTMTEELQEKSNMPAG